MTKFHLKRLNAPKSWPMNRRKGIKFVTRPLPGPHSLKNCISLSLVIKKLLNYAKTTREVKKILNDEKIIVNKKIIKEHKFPLGVMDIIEIPSIKNIYVLLLDEGGKFYLKPIKNSSEKLCKISGKTMLKKGHVQLNLFDGRNLIIKKDGYKVGDSVVFDLENKKINNHLKLDKGSLIFLTKGKHVGKVGVVESIKTLEGENPKIVFKTKDGVFETLKDYAFVINKEIVG